jgi:phage antirepressor YoqD-like protein
MMSNDELPDCFGDLEKVFPMGPNGLRETPEQCFYHCPVKTKCLQQAMATKNGIQVEEEVIERSSKAGAISFFERWSRKKQAYRRGLKMKK